MAVTDRHGLPVSICIESATPHEVKLATSTLVLMSDGGSRCARALERHAENFLGMLHRACCLILLRHL